MLKMILVAIAPSIALLIFIYQKDRYDREPSRLLLKLFIYGILCTIPVYFIELFLSSLNTTSAFFHAFAVAGFVEELFKFIILITFAFNTRHYNEKLDGIVYSVFTSMGFATAENILYVLNRQPEYLYTGISRGIFAVPAHALFAITMGYYLSLAKFAPGGDNSSKYMLKALVMPIILHGLYNYILITKMFGFFIIFTIYVIYLWKVNLKKLDIYVRESKDNI
jgi:protease PrsW